MGTTVVLDLYVDEFLDEAACEDAVEDARAILHRADELFSTWRPESAISRLRRGEVDLEDLPVEVGEVLGRCAELRETSRGWFDPWAMPGGVDPTGYVKGWAAQRALGALQVEGVHGAMVNAAGDVASWRRSSASSPFRVGVTDPWRRDELACVVEVVAAIATSGTYEQRGHLVNPFVADAAPGAVSATVTGRDLGVADALATALAVAGRDMLELLEAAPGYEGFVIDVDGERWATPKFPFALVARDSR